ncbi:MAG TPA: hypothetical protein VHA56_05380 [Mucilaginibacter sp.]|nr:hypothetical protein [Mucilaginibacter sp.]
MQFNPENKVVKLCAEGMQTEAEGKLEIAHSLFQKAWDIAENDFEAFTAAHYLARNQKNPKDNLKWNLEALRRAEKVGDESMKTHYPSLYLNVGKSYEQLGNLPEANRYYQLAGDYCEFLPEGKYADMIRTGVAEALRRTGTSEIKNEVIDGLIDKWCGQRELRPLGMVLPAYMGNLGTEKDRNKLISALSFLSATRCLDSGDQEKIDQLIRNLSADNSC